MNEIIAIRPNTFLKFILQIVASNIWNDMEEKEKIPYTQGKSLNDTLRKTYSMMIFIRIDVCVCIYFKCQMYCPFLSYLVLL